MKRHDDRPRRGGEAGFTIIEMVVALFVMVELILAVLLLFDFTNKLSRVQTNVADMQQSLRVSQYDTVRLIRMVGRGGLPISPITALPADANAAGTLQGGALSVRDNVPANALIAGPGTPAVLAGTDVLTVRGVFSTPLYQIVPNSSAFAVNTVTGIGTVTVSATAPNTTTGVGGGIPQHLDALVNAVKANVPEPLLLVSPVNDSIYAVVELDPSTSNVGTPTVSVTIGFKFKGGTRTTAYNALSSGGNYPAALTSVAQIGILEEYRIYVRSYTANPPAAGATAADIAAAQTPKLSRARTFPGTDDAYGPGAVASNLANLSLDVADDVTDFQVALGFDTPQGGGSIAAETATSLVDTNDNNDDWALNSLTDLPINAATWNNNPLYYIRLNTLVRTDRPDPKYTAPLLVRIEDHLYNDTTVGISAFNQGKNLMFRRRLLQTVVDLRNEQ